MNNFLLPDYLADQLEQAQALQPQGLTLRELYAGLAMAGILIGCYTNPDAETIPHDWVADQAKDHADTLIAALEDEDGQA